jgi:hypothetical protein
MSSGDQPNSLCGWSEGNSEWIEDERLSGTLYIVEIETSICELTTRLIHSVRVVIKYFIPQI